MYSPALTKPYGFHLRVCAIPPLCVILCDPMDCSPPGSSVCGLFRQEYWNGLPLPSPEDLSYLEIVPMSLLFPAFVGGCFYLCATWEDPNYGHIDFFPVIFQFSAPVFCIRTFPETFYLSPCLHYFLHPNLSYDHSPRARHLECEVKWVLGSVTMNKASGGDSIPVQILKDDAVKVLYSICQQI